jgi:hypothetical protein
MICNTKVSKNTMRFLSSANIYKNIDFIILNLLLYDTT